MRLLMTGLAASAVIATWTPLPAAAARAPVPVPVGAVLVSDTRGRLSVLSEAGHVLGTVPRAVGPYGAEAIALSHDRRLAYVAIRRGDEQPPALFAIDLASGVKHLVATGLDPALSPDGTQLAYIATTEAPAGDYYVTTGLAILDLAAGTTRLLSGPSDLKPGRSPHGPVNWSPDGKTIAVFDGARIRLVDVATANDLASGRPVPGDKPDHAISARVYPSGPPPGSTPPTLPPGIPGITVTTAPPPQTTATSQAPVFLDVNTLVAVYDCCTGYSHLVSFDLRTGRRATIAALYGPPVAITQLSPGRLLVVTAANLLDVVTPGHTKLVATKITAAAV